MRRKIKILYFQRILVFHNPFIYLLIHKQLTRSSKLKTKFALRFQTEIFIWTLSKLFFHISILLTFTVQITATAL